MAAGFDSPDEKKVLSHAHAITMSDEFELIGFFDTNKYLAQKEANRWNTGIISELDDVKNIADVAVCAVPDEFHYDVLIELSKWRKLKAVVCEKPITNNISEAYALQKRYSECNISVFVNYTRRYLSEFQELHHWIEDSAGKFINGTCLYGKGTIHNCSHFINLLQYLFGNIKIDKISNEIVDFYQDDPSYGFIASVAEGYINFQVIPCNVTTVFEMDLCFEKGRVRFDDTTATISYYEIKKSVEYAGYKNYAISNVVHIDRNWALLNLYANIDRCIVQNDSIVSGLDDAVCTLEICEKIVEKNYYFQ